jgi:hypothetical protein
MPWVRRHRKLLRKSTILRGLQIVLVLLIISVIAGKLTIVLSNIFSSVSSMDSTKIVEEQKQSIMDSYKKKYGADWKEKIIKDYNNYAKR